MEVIARIKSDEVRKRLLAYLGEDAINDSHRRSGFCLRLIRFCEQTGRDRAWARESSPDHSRETRYARAMKGVHNLMRGTSPMYNPQREALGAFLDSLDVAARPMPSSAHLAGVTREEWIERAGGYPLSDELVESMTRRTLELEAERALEQALDEADRPSDPEQFELLDVLNELDVGIRATRLPSETRQRVLAMVAVRLGAKFLRRESDD